VNSVSELPGKDLVRSMTAAAVTGLGIVGPDPGAGPDWFDVRTRLGPRGYKYLPPAAQYLLAAGRIASAEGCLTEVVPPPRRGFVLATNGGLADLFDKMDRTILETGSEELAPAMAPYFAVNVLGSRLAAEQALKGFSLTLTAPHTAAVDAIGAGLRALAAGRCDVVTVVATEHRLPGAGAGEEGAVALVLETHDTVVARGTPVLGTVDARTVFAPPRLVTTPDGRTRLAALLDRAVRELGAAGLPVQLVADGSPVASAVAAALGTDHGEPVGKGCLAAALRATGLLTRPGSGGALLVVATAEGRIALTTVRAPHPRPPADLRESRP
jgi:3-oxoacyl-[acyl-carrier-protein] synthase II